MHHYTPLPYPTPPGWDAQGYPQHYELLEVDRFEFDLNSPQQAISGWLVFPRTFWLFVNNVVACACLQLIPQNQPPFSLRAGSLFGGATWIIFFESAKGASFGERSEGERSEPAVKNESLHVSHWISIPAPRNVTTCWQLATLPVSNN